MFFVDHHIFEAQKHYSGSATLNSLLSGNKIFVDLNKTSFKENGANTNIKRN